MATAIVATMKYVDDRHRTPHGSFWFDEALIVFMGPRVVSQLNDRFSGKTGAVLGFYTDQLPWPPPGLDLESTKLAY